MRRRTFLHRTSLWSLYLFALLTVLLVIAGSLGVFGIGSGEALVLIIITALLRASILRLRR